MIHQPEQRLDSFDPEQRRQALATLSKKVQSGEIDLPAAGTDVNLHCHTFFSYNAAGYSPTALAWEGRKQGLEAVGCVDFDVLDAVTEMLEAGDILGLKTVAGRW